MTFVLLHGAWHGGWCWQAVADILVRRGNRVTAPTQTGLGERRHLLTPNVGFDTFVQDVVNHVRYENLSEAVLVAHSFGASVAAAAAGIVADRLQRVIFLDGFLVPSGSCALDQKTPACSEERIAAGNRTSGGLSFPVPEGESFGIKDPAMLESVKELLTPHPLRTYLDRIEWREPVGGGLPCDYIRCVNPPYPGLEDSVRLARRNGWTCHSLSYGHDVMLEAPRATADLLEQVANRRST